jgi:hypothetical protein
MTNFYSQGSVTFIFGGVVMGLRRTRAAMKIMSYGADGAGASKGRDCRWYWRVRCGV